MLEEAATGVQAAARHAGARCRPGGAARRRRRCPRASTRRCSCATAICRTRSASRDGYSIDLQGRDRAARPGVRAGGLRQADRDVLRRLADAHRAGQAAAGTARACCCSTSRPTTSTSTRATGSRSTCHDYPHAVILVSHDRYFLDAVVTRIAELDAPHAHRLRRQLREVPATSATRGIERLRKAKREQDEEIARIKRSSTASATRRPRRRRCRAGSRCSTRSCRSRCRPSGSASTSRFPPAPKSGRTVLELKHVRKAYGDRRGLRRSRPAHRARRSHRAGRAQRRRQVDADADAVRRGSAGQRRRGPRAIRSSCSTSPRTRRRGSIRR